MRNQKNECTSVGFFHWFQNLTGYGMPGFHWNTNIFGFIYQKFLSSYQQYYANCVVGQIIDACIINILDHLLPNPGLLIFAFGFNRYINIYTS